MRIRAFSIIGLFSLVSATALANTSTLSADQLQNDIASRLGFKYNTQFYVNKGKADKRNYDDVGNIDNFVALTYKLSPTETFELRQFMYLERNNGEGKFSEGEQGAEYSNTNLFGTGTYGAFQFYAPTGLKRRDTVNTGVWAWIIHSVPLSKMWSVDLGTNPRLEFYGDERGGSDLGAAEPDLKWGKFLHFAELGLKTTDWLSIGLLGGLYHSHKLNPALNPATNGSSASDSANFLMDLSFYIRPTENLKIVAYAEQLTSDAKTYRFLDGKNTDYYLKLVLNL